MNTGPQQEPELDLPSLRSLGEKCDDGCGREAVLKFLDYKEREIGVWCESCAPDHVPRVEDADGRLWPF